MPYRQTAHPQRCGLPVADGQAAEGIRRAKASEWLNLKGLYPTWVHKFLKLSHIKKRWKSFWNWLRQKIGSQTNLARVAGGAAVHFGGPRGKSSTLDRNNHPGDSGWLLRRGWPLPNLLLEPGRMIVARAALWYIPSAPAKRQPMGHTLHLLLRWQIICVPLSIRRAIRPSGRLPTSPVSRKTTLVGKFCETGDQLIQEVWLPPVDRGDCIAMPVAGAYHLAMSSNYNLAPRRLLW